jgi:hypothetical protein
MSSGMKIGTLTTLATHLNGAADSGKFDRITVGVVLRELGGGDILGLLEREMGDEVDLGRLSQDDRGRLVEHWRRMAAGFEPRQFHVDRSGLSLLVAYILHLIYCMDYVPPK